MALPSKLRINGREVALRPRKGLYEFGLWYEDKNRIDYRTRMDINIKRDTLLHEVMHAIRSLQGREYGGEVEEDYVRSLATGLIGVFDDNPEFARWLITRGKEPNA